MQGRKTSKETRKRVRDSYETSDLPISIIAERFGVNLGSIYLWIKKGLWKRQHKAVNWREGNGYLKSRI